MKLTELDKLLLACCLAMLVVWSGGYAVEPARQFVTEYWLSQTTAKLHVLAVYPIDLTKVPQAVLAVKTSPDVWSYLDSHCQSDSNGRGHRFLVEGQDVSHDAAWVATLAAKAKVVPLPSLVIESSSKIRYCGPLPDESQTLALLKKFGG